MGTQVDTTAPEALLRFEQLGVGLVSRRSTASLVENVSLTLNRNEIVCLVGESGSGKTLTARAPIGLFSTPSLRVTSGRILFDGEDLARATRGRLRALRGARIAMIFQEPMSALNPLMRVGHQVEEVMLAHGFGTREQRRSRVTELFAEVRLPDPERVYHAYPHQLSGGQRQRVMIAMALALEPDVLLADEPTTALDVTTQKQILALIRMLQEKHGTGVLFITHDFGVVSEIADRVVVMKTGHIVESGSRDEVLMRPQHPYTRQLIDAIPRPEILSGGSANAEVILEARNVSKSFGGKSGLPSGAGKPKQVLFDVSTVVRRGETFGIVGESGSGKSTIGRILAGLMPRDSGDVLFCGTPVGQDRAAQRRFRQKVQVIFQDPYGSLNPRRKVGEIIASGPVAMGVGRTEARKIALEKLALVDLPLEAADRWPHQFSGGQRQRIAIARALALEPELIIADEATSALDVSVQAQVLDLLKDLKDRLGLTLVFITHDLRVAAGICDSVAVMEQGRIVEQGSAAQVFGHPENAYTRRLLDSVPGRVGIQTK